MDLGCGHGFEVRALWQRGTRPVGIDLSAGMLSCAADVVPGRLVQADVRRLPLATGALDGVWSVHALLHLAAAELPAVLAEVRRVLRPGGQLALSVAGGSGTHREEVAYWPGPYRTFVHWQIDALLAVCRESELRIDDSGTAPEAGRDTIWLLGHRSDS